MERIKQISEQGRISFNEGELAHAILEKGGLVVVSADEGKYGKFISLYIPGEKHKELVERYLNNKEENGK